MTNPLRTILFFLLLALVVPIFAQDDTRISATWQVQKYDISATLPLSDSDRGLVAKAILTVKNITSRPVSSLTLRISPNAVVSGVSVNGAAVEFNKNTDKVGTGTLQRISLRILAVQPGGILTVTVDYKLTVTENTGLVSISPITSQFLPMSFWYPTPNSWFFARGADFAPFSIRVNQQAGRMPVTSGVETEGTFDQRLKGQPFLAVGNWDTVILNGVEVYMPKGSGVEEKKRAAEAAEIAAEAKVFVSEILGTAPSAPIRIVSTRRGAGFSGGGTIFIDEGVFRRPKIDALTTQGIVDSVVKMWIGDSTAVVDDGYGVIREGLVRYIATQFLEKKFGAGPVDIERMRQRNAYSAVAKRDSPLSQVAPLDDYYFPAVANKGAMIWRLMVKKIGQDAFFETVRAALRDGVISLAELRSNLSAHKEFLDYMIDQVTDTNLLVGLPQQVAGEFKVALLNAGSVDVNVNVQARLANGQNISTPASIRAKSLGEVIFRTPEKVIRVEIDPEKFYPQTDYSDDVAPREFDDSDLLLAVKRLFDKQDFAGAEKAARTVLRNFSNYDEVRVLLARSLLSQGKNADAEREFKAVLDEKLPTARSIAWANVGLGEVAARSGLNAEATAFAREAIRSDADYGSSLAARVLRNRIGGASAIDDDIKAFFTQFDSSAVSNRKAEIDALAAPGEVIRFVSGVSGQTVAWKSDLRHVDKLDQGTVLVEASMTLRLLNREVETGMAVFRLARVGNGWRLIGVDIFEVR